MEMGVETAAAGRAEGFSEAASARAAVALVPEGRVAWKVEAVGHQADRQERLAVPLEEAGREKAGGRAGAAMEETAEGVVEGGNTMS